MAPNQIDCAMKQHQHPILSSTNLVFIRSKLCTAQNQPLYLDCETKMMPTQGAHVVVNLFHGGATQQWIISDNGMIRNNADKKLVIDVQNKKG